MVGRLDAAFINPSALSDCPAEVPGVLPLASVRRRQRAVCSLADHAVLIRSDCLGAIAAIRKGSFRSPALQGVAIKLLHNHL